MSKPIRHWPSVMSALGMYILEQQYAIMTKIKTFFFGIRQFCDFVISIKSYKITIIEADEK